SGVPTIRVFEALACGIPLLCAPWADTEGLFRPGEDYLCVPDGRAMTAELRRLISDSAAREQMASRGLETVQTRHTCAHRARQFLDICEELGK
ncbi:MAG TPA: glycosyltransferase, partial [Terriglobales bacterium]|nr:glycosyltransferase [Terriglobales bacterium]